MGVSILGIKRLEVFNRWGSIVYSETNIDYLDPQAFWDGRIGGEKAAAGVCIWQLTVALVDGTELLFFGDVGLIR